MASDALQKKTCFHDVHVVKGTYFPSQFSLIVPVGEFTTTPFTKMVQSEFICPFQMYKKNIIYLQLTGTMTFASMRPFFYIFLLALRALTGRFYFSMSDRLPANTHHSEICPAISLSLSLETLQMCFGSPFLPLFMNVKFSVLQILLDLN